MPLQALKLENFRNYSKFSITFSSASNLIFGVNGLGKTNLLEAVYFALLLKSYRTKRDQDLVHWGEKFLRVELGFRESKDNQEDIKKIEVFYDYPQGLKQVKFDSVKQPLLRALGRIKVVFFSPESIQLLTSHPGGRRRFLDLILAQTDRRYLYEIRQFNQILKQRNFLLWRLRGSRAPKAQEDLGIWDKQFLSAAAVISQKRRQLSRFLNNRLATIYQQIAQNQDRLEMSYQTNDLNDFISRHQQDIALGFTETGPQRDDLKFTLNDRLIVHSGSRGELRTATLALKVAELECIQEKTSQRPLLLLDDVFSELDTSRRHYLERLIFQYQTIVTAINNDDWRGDKKIDLAAELKKAE